MIACAAPDFSPRKPSLTLPALACDCHAHIVGPASQFAYAADRIYTPPDCLLADYTHMLQTLGLQRAVLVQPSVYGTDNTVLLKSLEEARNMGVPSPEGAHLQLRGVAVVKADIGTEELQTMHTLGVRGVRVNVVDVKDDSAKGQLPMPALRALAERIAPLGWHMEFLMHVNEFPDLDTAFAGFPVDVVFGHMGYLPTSRGTADAGFQSLLRLLQSGRAWAKLTGPYRLTAAALPYADTSGFVKALLDAACERVVWGSDWPHVMLKGTMPNDADLLELLEHWVPDPGMRDQVLVRNPARLYGF